MASSARLVVAALLLATSAAHAGSTSSRSKLAPEVEKWMASLQSEKSFYIARSDDVRALLQHPQGDAAFKQLLAKGPIPAKLYALCGLYFTDMEAFKAGVTRLAKSNAMVRTWKGDMGADEPAGEIVKRPGSEGFIAPTEAPVDWRRKNPLRPPPDDRHRWRLDPAHGPRHRLRGRPVAARHMHRAAVGHMFIVLLDEPGLFEFPSAEYAERYIEPPEAEFGIRAAFDDAAVPYRVEWLRAKQFDLFSKKYKFIPAGPPDQRRLIELIEAHPNYTTPPEARAQLDVLVAGLRDR